MEDGRGFGGPLGATESGFERVLAPGCHLLVPVVPLRQAFARVAQLLGAVPCGAGDPGPDHARAEGGDADGAALLSQLGTHGLGDGDDRVLRGVVGGEAGNGDVPCRGGGVDDAAGVAGEHVRQEHPQAVDDAPKVHAQDPLPVLRGHQVRPLLDPHAGVVEKQVHAAVALQSGLAERIHRGSVRHVGEDSADLDAGSAQFSGRPSERRLLHVGQDEAAACGPESLGYTPAETAGGSGDDRHLALECTVRCHLSTPCSS